MEKINVGTKGKTSKQGLTCSMVLTIMLHHGGGTGGGGGPLPTLDLNKITNLINAPKRLLRKKLLYLL